MISCDLCGSWYHMRCVGVTQSQARSLKKYQCPVCVAVKASLKYIIDCTIDVQSMHCLGSWVFNHLSRMLSSTISWLACTLLC